ncbi:MAG: AAA family ATPase [Clostridia bacterium]|nr:AAA family ATPase [Clostridia bacterium]
MANLIVVSGPQAVGKMTVAEALRDKLRYHMMMNHDSIELSDRIFGFGTPAQREFNGAIRESAFALAVKHNVDLIFTFVCAFDMPEDVNYLKALEAQFTESGGAFYFVELSATLETRLFRNETPHRMEMKPTKRNMEWSRRDILETAEQYKLNTDAGETLFAHHLKIDNTHLSPDEVADRVIAAFGLVPNEKEDWDYRFGV